MFQTYKGVNWMYKVGDRVRVLYPDEIDERKGIRKGDIFTVIRHTGKDHVIVDLRDRKEDYLYTNQIEKVEESKEMTFPEMAQKLIDGEFEVGTELICDDTSYFVGHATSYFVDHATINGYGLKSSINTAIVSVDIGASKMNKNWIVKEEPIKEMSIEELQKELGYKIKIVE